MASLIYNAFKSNLLKGSFNLDNGGNTIKVALFTATHTPSQDDDEDFADVDNEVSGTGYTAGGATLGSQTVTKDNTDNEGVFDGADVTWSSSTITARAAIPYKSTGTPANDLLIAYFDFGSDQSSSSGNFVIQWNSEGIINLT